MPPMPPHSNDNGRWAPITNTSTNLPSPHSYNHTRPQVPRRSRRRGNQTTNNDRLVVRCHQSDTTGQRVDVTGQWRCDNTMNTVWWWRHNDAQDNYDTATSWDDNNATMIQENHDATMSQDLAVVDDLLDSTALGTRWRCTAASGGDCCRGWIQSPEEGRCRDDAELLQSIFLFVRSMYLITPFIRFFLAPLYVVWYRS